MMEWTSPQKPAELTENRLIDAILDGAFPIGSALPGERELAAQLKVTRPTLREALQRLGRDGWLEIHQGKPTRVRDYWREGSLGVLGTIARRSTHLPPDFVPNLLAVRLALAPAYSALAARNDPASVLLVLADHQKLPDTAEAFASFDWRLHNQLTIACGNPIFTLILNGFAELYGPMAVLYFQPPESRQRSRVFYAELGQAFKLSDPIAAETVTRAVMQDSLRLWEQRGLLRQT